MLPPIFVRLKTLLFRHRVDAELDEEMRYHLDREVERNLANGMTVTGAHHAARLAFGNVTVATEQARDAWRWRLAEELRQDVAFALRTFRRAPTFVLTVVATIGLGLGLLTTAFTVFNAYVLRPLAVRDPYTLYEMSWHAKSGSWHSFTGPQYQRLAADRTAFSESFGYAIHVTHLRGSVAIGLLVAGNYFDMLGVPPAIGRTLLPEDALPPSGRPVIVLSHRMWRAVFGGDSTIVGRSVRLNGVPLTVVGVAREGFGGLGDTPHDFWAPLTASVALRAGPDPFGPTPTEGIRVVGRLKPGLPLEQVRQALVARLRVETVDRPPSERAATVQLTPRGTSMPATGEIYTLFAPLGAAFLLVMLIACANVANMMLARGLARQREIGIRLALGAGRGRLIRQLLTEAILLSVPAAVVGFLVSRAALDLSLRALFATIPTAFVGYLRVIPLDADGTLALFMFGTAAVATLAFGLAPALQATRPNIVQASRGDFDTELRPSRLRNGLVVAQITLSVVLLICAGVLLGNAKHTQQLDPGLRTRDVLQIDVVEPFRSRVLGQLRADPNVRVVASAQSSPLDGGLWVIMLRSASLVSEATCSNAVSPEYFGAVGLQLIRGRTFTAEEASSRAPVVIVSEAAARRFWPHGDAIGQTLSRLPDAVDRRAPGSFESATVIGVVANAIPGMILRPATWPTVYYPRPVDAIDSRILARVSGDAERVRPLIARELTAIDSSAVSEMHSLQSSLDVQVYPFRAAFWIASAVGYIALLLTLTGVYGVLSYVVSQRRKEFGIRMALGAAGATVIALVLRQSLRLAVLGVAVGVAVALGLSRLFSTVLVIADAFDVRGYVGGVVVVLVACVIAAYFPSRRAARTDPARVLRSD